MPNFLPICHMNPRSRIVLSDPDVLLIGRSGARHAVDYARMRRFRSVFLIRYRRRDRPFLSVPDRLCLLLLSSTAGLVWQGLWGRHIVWPVFFIFTLLAFLFLVLLVYTLFFALPFHDTYIHGTTAPSLCRSGVYALCRHPGVLWLSGFYLCLYAALGTRMLLAAFVVFTLFDIAYVVFQDRWSFPKQFPEYDDYRQSTPFLLPNVRSIRQCVRTWRGTGDGSHEV